MDFALNISGFTQELSTSKKTVSLSPYNIYFSHWKSLYYPKEAFDFNGRLYITYYGLRNGPYLNMKYSNDLFNFIDKSVFPFSYATQNAMEDFAELVSLGILCQNKSDCSIKVSSGDDQYMYPIMQSPILKSRFKGISPVINGNIEISNTGFEYCNK